ncbi:MAG: N-6 DNA methylase, partial [Gammaproteobacteria bacterium]|nr:N-6 DNA methylase [Gammaproteobacteria bacterium]
MLLQEAADWLGWPEPQSIFGPTGAGANVWARLAKQKIGDPLTREFFSLVVNTGILTQDHNGPDTPSPLAIVCEFCSGASDEALKEAHRLAWNFSRAPLLITLEPHRLIVWSCLQDPSRDDDSIRIRELSVANTGGKHQREIRELLHWVSLITGDIQKRLPEHFPSDGRADTLLLKNLKDIRRRLIDNGLERAYCHDLLARVVFTQFLFHRKDSRGTPFFSAALLSELHDENILKRKYTKLASILADKDETYALFRWMDERFNGDLFPGKAGQSKTVREIAWLAEKEAVGSTHLQLLADLVSGKINTTDGQLLLWPHYAFDTIPLEFISSVYEEFLKDNRDLSKAYYTPPQLVDYLLDAVLPWDGEDWDLKILDPACGSGIFLVKGFQRLIHRWRNQYNREPHVKDLKPILEKNLFGVDKDADAVRVACFSLYLAMIDAIDPRHYVTDEKVFPRLRGTRLVQADFFDESVAGIRTEIDSGSFDLVIGNAPWGDGSIRTTSDTIVEEIPARGRKKAKTKQTTKARLWSKHNQWPVANNDIGPLFVSKGLSLIKESGQIAMVQPATPWLYQRGGLARKLRKKLFESFTVEEITNLSALRRDLFTDVIGPACILVVGRSLSKPDDTLLYITPKPRKLANGAPDFRIDPQDVNRISHAEAANDPWVWSVLALGGKRDLYLIRKLLRYKTLAVLKKDGEIKTRRGVIPGVEERPDLRNVPYLNEDEFPDNVIIEIDADGVTPWKEPRIHPDAGSRDFTLFENPQLIIKLSYTVGANRFRAVLVRSNDPKWGIICKRSYLSVQDMTGGGIIERAVPVYNSLLATYFMFLTSSRVGHYRPEALVEELETVPLPNISSDLAKVASVEDVDEPVYQAFSLTKADRTIIKDFLNITLPDIIREGPGPGHESTRRHDKDAQEPELIAFADTAIRVLKATFGQDKLISATLYQEHSRAQKDWLPVRMLTIHLNQSN